MIALFDLIIHNLWIVLAAGGITLGLYVHQKGKDTTWRAYNDETKSTLVNTGAMCSDNSDAIREYLAAIYKELRRQGRP